MCRAPMFDAPSCNAVGALKRCDDSMQRGAGGGLCVPNKPRRTNMTPSLALHTQPKDFVTHLRSRDGSRSDSKFEKEVVLPAMDQQDCCLHAWADARFCAENMAEHAQFFALQIPQ